MKCFELAIKQIGWAADNLCVHADNGGGEEGRRASHLLRAIYNALSYGSAYTTVGQSQTFDQAMREKDAPKQSREEQEANWKAYKQAARKIEKRVEAACKAAGYKVVRVTYAHYVIGDGDVPIDNLGQTAIPGKCRIKNCPHTFFSARGKEYLSDVLENPTWLELTVLANEMIRVTGDHHHRFFEGVELVEPSTNKMPHYQFIMGS
jgi:hypothetical protein